MQDNKPTTQTRPTPSHPRRSRRRVSDRQGSAVILVIVSIVLIAILGATMVQVARFERLTDSQDNIDVVVASVLDLIAIRLGEDLTDDAGNLFNPGGSFATGGQDEPYDYPFTRPASVGFLAERIDGTTAAAWGGIFDDMWLADAAPNAAGTAWPHITNLNGLFLSAGGTSDLSSAAAPTETPVQGQDTNVIINTLLVDTDGDGIRDSRWAWAPIKQIGATRYVMAVRIIDLSARLDANVALAQFDSNAATPNLAEGIARGDSPSELDGAGFAAAYAVNSGSGTAAQGQAEWEATMSYRVSGNPTGNFPPPGMPYGDRNTSLTREHYWYRGAARVSSSFSRSGETGAGFDYTNVYGVSDAFELLQKGGLDSPATALIEQHMPLLTRDGANEGDYSATTFGGTITGFFTNNPRSHMTPFSGIGIYAKPASQNNSAFTTLGRQVDINRAAPAALSQAILDILGNPSSPLTLAHLASATAVSNQLAANLKDYSDEDNWVTLAGGQYGFEALPMITEVYAEREYVYASAIDTSGAGTSWDVTWNQTTGVSYMIEISNPYHRPISLQDVQLRINGVPVTDGAAAGDLASLFATPVNVLEPGQTIILFRNDATSTSPDLQAAVAAGHVGPTPEAVADNWSPAAGTVLVTLHAKEDATNDSYDNTAASPATYLASPYQAAEVIGMPDVYLETGYTSDPGAGAAGALQVSSQGNGNGLNALHVTSSQFFNNGDAVKQQPASTPAGSVPVAMAIGLANKPAGKADAAGMASTDQQIVHQDRPMKYVGDLLQVPIFGFEAGITIADQLDVFGITTAAQPQFEQLMLPYGAAAPKVDGSIVTLNYPHGVLLLDRLTVDSPYEDGEDNNGNGTADDAGEFVIPGRINLNTAPEELLRRILPYPTQAARDTAAALIVAFRNNPSAAGFGAAGIPGIAYVGALYEQMQLLGFNPSQQAGDTRTLGGGQVDWNDYESNPATGAATEYTVDGKTYNLDGIGDDREEKIMLAKWLNEVGSTRSDVFAAYILVQGYPAGDFTGGAVESAKLIAIFTRTNVRGGGDKAQILGVLRLE